MTFDPSLGERETGELKASWNPGGEREKGAQPWRENG